jgi:hypothetical protein
VINNLADAFRRVFKNIYESLKEEEIRIVKKGNRITAAYYVDGKCVRHANAKCSVDDNFNFEYGSKLAFKRMWGDPNA